MANWEFYDEREEVEFEEKEPSFSIYDFRKWLESNNQEEPSIKENVNRDTISQDKDVLKEQFKQRVKERVQNNIDKKMAERKKKRG